MPAPTKNGAPVRQDAPQREQTDNADAKRSAELETLKAENARLIREAEQAKTAAAQAEAEAKEAREKADAALAIKAQREADAEAEAAMQEAAITRQLNAQRRVRIVLASGRDPHERAPVPIGVNGREYLISRDKEVDVPQAVINVLDHAIEQVADVREVNGQRHVTFHEAKRFNYTVKGYVDPKTGVFTPVR